MKRFSAIIISLILFITCTRQEYDNVDKNYFFNAYDTLVYKCMQTNETDSFVVIAIKNGYHVIDGHYNEEYYEIGLKEINFHCINNCDEIDIYRTSRNFLLEMNNRNFFYSNNYKNLYPVTYRLDNKVIKNVYIVTDSTDAKNETDIVVMYYSDIYGVIRYDQKNGEVFELQLNN
jgi:hypothetical protein